jgi:hypothetical protein
MNTKMKAIVNTKYGGETKQGFGVYERAYRSRQSKTRC